MAHLAFVISSLGGGGAERVLTTLANHWAREGHDITILTFQPPSPDDYVLEPSITRVPLNLQRNSGGTIDAIRRNVKRIRILRKALKDANPDAVIAFATRQSVLTSVAAMRLGIPVIASERNNPAKAAFLNAAWRRLLTWGYALPHGIVTPTEAAQAALQRQTMARHVIAIPNPLFESSPPVDARRDHSTPERADGGLRTVLALGRLVEQTGFDTLLEAFATIAHERPEWRLAIVGEGPEREALEARRDRLQLSSKLTMPAWSDYLAAQSRYADAVSLSPCSQRQLNCGIEVARHSPSLRRLAAASDHANALHSRAQGHGSMLTGQTA